MKDQKKIDEVLYLLKEGFTVTQIAKRQGVQNYAIYKRIKGIYYAKQYLRNNNRNK